MKIKKKYSFSDKRQVWRLLLSDTEKLIIETRDTEKKEVYYSCIDLFSGKKIFKNFQPDEKYWISIETVHDDIIFFHKFAKPDMPEHNFIQAFNLNSRKILWQSDKYIFLFIHESDLYCYEKKLTGNTYYILDPRTGEIKSTPDLSEADLLELNYTASESKDYSNYLFPEKYFPDQESSLSPEFADSISSEINLLEIVGPVEYVAKGNFLIFNFHSKVSDKLENKLVVKDILGGKNLFSAVINKSVNAYAPDSFFIYKNLLIYLKDKNEVFVSEITE